jgi:hypothetical protein
VDFISRPTKSLPDYEMLSPAAVGKLDQWARMGVGRLVCSQVHLIQANDVFQTEGGDEGGEKQLDSEGTKKQQSDLETVGSGCGG